MRAWYNPDGVTAYYMVPAILGIIVTMTMVIMIGRFVRERERYPGTVDRNPIRSLELMIGKIIPYIVLGYPRLPWRY